KDTGGKENIEKSSAVQVLDCTFCIYTEIKKEDETSEAICNGRTNQNGQGSEYAGFFIAPPARAVQTCRAHRVCALRP
ncbi:MAG: hypothetical protein E6066_19580, partial [Oscillospiraceae bacterium]|nr:hypothetical protein [Oscillospiraceae bacterium]